MYVTKIHVKVFVVEMKIKANLRFSSQMTEGIDLSQSWAENIFIRKGYVIYVWTTFAEVQAFIRDGMAEYDMYFTICMFTLWLHTSEKMLSKYVFDIMYSIAHRFA